MSAVCQLSELVEGDPLRVEVDGEPVVVVRIGDDVYAIGDTCSHADVSLAEGGEVDLSERTIECYMHGSAFGLVDGEPTCLPATAPVPVYDAKVGAGGDVIVERRP